MNRKKLQTLFSKYIEKFEVLNSPPHIEYYKWIIAKKFRSLMDEALPSPPEQFANALKQVRKLSDNLIDNYLQPFHGLVKCAEKEPETIRNMFLYCMVIPCV